MRIAEEGSKLGSSNIFTRLCGEAPFVLRRADELFPPELLKPHPWREFSIDRDPKLFAPKSLVLLAKFFPGNREHYATSK
jgi:hypothetical protein